MAMAISAIALISRDNDIGTIEPNQADHILQEHLIIPFFQGFVEAFGITEIDSTTEKEVNAVVTDSSEVLLCPDDSERVEEFGPDKICATFATRGRVECCSDSLSTTEPC